MKRLLPILFLSFFGFTELFAQFSTGNPLVTLTHRIRNLGVVDLDNDGLLDVVSLSVEDNRTAWYRNLGNGTFDYQRIISQEIIEPETITFADVDADGDADFFLASSGDEKVYLFLNDGTGNMTLSQIVLSGYRDVHNLIAADVDGDNDLDLIAGHLKGKEIVWFANDGGGHFGGKQVITNQSNWWTEIDLGDLDGDGDLDVLISSESDDQIMWYPNEGVLGFGEAKIIPTNITLSYGIQTFDVDLDGDMDIVARYSITDAEGQRRRMVWLANEGDGTFGEEQFISDMISLTYFVDIDKDGDVDIVTGPGIGKPLLIQNMGQGVFATPKTLDVENEKGFNKMVFADLDNDNELDLLGVSNHGDHNEILWFQNVGDLHFVEQVEVVTTLEKPRLIHPMDFDEDGDMDLLVGSGWEQTLYWYENDGSEHFQHRHVVLTDFSDSQDILMVDLDGDTDLDMLLASSETSNSELYWYENQGDNSFTNKTTIRNFEYSLSDIEVADLDKDGDLDIVTGAQAEGEGLIWMENTGTGTFENHHIIEPSRYVVSIKIADIDGDGYDDVLLGADSGGYNIRWYRNTTGDEEEELEEWEVPDTRMFREIRYINKIWSDVSVNTADLNGDGTLDVVVSSERADKIVWYANDGEGNFGEEQIIESDLEYLKYVRVADFDLDGDSDIAVLASSDLGRIVWFENKGDATFESAQWIQTPLARTEYNQTTFLVEDMNGDGKADFLLTGSEEDNVYWFENKIIGVDIEVVVDIQHAIKAYPNPFSHYTTIEVKNLSQGSYQLHLTDMLGRTLKKLKIEGGKADLERGDLKSGLYFLQIFNSKGKQPISSTKVLVR